MARMINTISYDQHGMNPVAQLNSEYETAGIPDDIMEKMLSVMADIIEPEIRKNAGTMLNEKGYSIKGTMESIKRGKMKKDKYGNRYMQIDFSGTRADGKKATEIAFINEYGLGKLVNATAGRAVNDDDTQFEGRFFIQKALEDKADEAVAAMEKVFRDWEDKNDFMKYYTR